jgi:hypothetical protein
MRVPKTKTRPRSGRYDEDNLPKTTAAPKSLHRRARALFIKFPKITDTTRSVPITAN